MLARFILTRELRALLRLPLGDLLKGNEEENMERLKGIVAKDNPPRVICIGDRVCRSAVKAGCDSWVKIVDGREMRREVGTSGFKGGRVFIVKNEPGTINEMAWRTVYEAIRYEGALVLVRGEEDLLALPAILEAPEGSIVVYGQPPRAGIVIVKVDEDKRSLVRSVIDSMDYEPS
ncbi:MAG: GTP-dependent dephospho-CoA kinase family protein [Candidatus Bathyarchaeia archaeon]